MKSAGWYFKKGARKVFVATMAEAHRLAQAIADQTGKKSSVGWEPPPRSPKVQTHRKAAGQQFRSNPDPFNILDVLVHQERAKADRRAFTAKTKGRRLAKSLRHAPGAAGAEARRALTGKFQVTAMNRKERFTLFRPSRAAATQLARQFEAAGYNVAVAEV